METEKYADYSVVVESTTPAGSKAEDVVEVKRDGLEFLRFRSCLQSFELTNRNRRNWHKPHMQLMLGQDYILEMLKHGWPGESGHCIPKVGEVSMARILTIDPNNISHKIYDLDWKGDLLYSTVETLDDGEGQPGDKFRRHILQGLDPAFSVRAVVPQKKQLSGVTEVTGPGRLVCWDRVFLPSHEEAYVDESVPIKNVKLSNRLESVFESFGQYVLESSSRVQFVTDDLNPVMESAEMDPNGLLSLKTEAEGRIFLYPERKYRNEFQDVLAHL